MTIHTYRDPWGIPHLCADGALELAYAQGRNAAVDRAFQIEVDRHRSQGTSASFLGAEAVAWDRFARQCRLDDTAQRCFARLDEGTRAFVQAYVDGVNAGLPLGVTRAPEFGKLGLPLGQFQPWTPLGIWLATHILFAGFPSKLWREEVVAKLGLDALELFATEGPRSAGSNGWLLAGARTTHGSPILAGDPHRFIEDPGVYQQVHLACPEFDVLGLAVPGVPGLAHFGHAGSVAWAITNAMADYQDLFYEQLRRRDGVVEALGPDGFQVASSHFETIDVRDGEPVRVEVIETERGPVVVGGVDAQVAVSLRHLPRVTGELGFACLLPLLRARTVADVDRALARWLEPVNVLQAADSRGGLLHRVVGKVPLRHADNSLRVVPAWEPRHGWDGVREALPSSLVGEVAVMANERGLAAPLGVEFAPPHRAGRIRHLLSERTQWSARDMAAIHTDSFLASSRPLLGWLRRLDGLSEAAASLRARLLAWNGHMSAESTDAAAYARLRDVLVRSFAAQPVLAPLAELRQGLHDYPEVFWPWLLLLPRVAFALEGLLSSAQLPEIDRAELIRSALEEVAAQGSGDEPWGELHRLAPWQAQPSDEAWPGLPGDHDCVNSAGSIPGVTHHCLRGPAARFVWDLARRDDSLWVVPFGASGVSGDAHHRDQLPLWLGGELLPVCSEREHWIEEEDTLPDFAPPRTPLYERDVPELGRVRIVPVDPARDIALIDAWVKEDRAEFWGMRAHTPAFVQEIYQYLESLSTHHAYLLWRDEQPVALMQTYEPHADPVGEHYAVRDGDFGIHVFVAKGGQPEHGFTDALLRTFIAFVGERPNTQRLVIEPDVRNARAMARFRRAGFVAGPEIALPEKRAQLMFLDLTGEPHHGRACDAVREQQ